MSEESQEKIEITKHQAHVLANTLKLYSIEVRNCIEKMNYSRTDKNIRLNLIKETEEYFKVLFGIDITKHAKEDFILEHR